MRHVRAHAAWIVVLVTLIAAWQAWVRLRGVPQYVLPAPTDVDRTLWDERGPLASAAGVTAREMLAGFALALGLAWLRPSLCTRRPRCGGRCTRCWWRRRASPSSRSPRSS